MNGLDLFSGIGGLSLALKEWVRTVAYCEIDPYCQGVLLSRMHDRCLQEAAIWDDIMSFDGHAFCDKVDIIFGGFPCQNISVAGNGAGLEGKQSGLFFEIMRLSKEIKPRFIFLENVPAITTRGGLQVVREVAKMGYDCRWIIKSCKEEGSPQQRKRWFCLAYTNGESGAGLFSREAKKQPKFRMYSKPKKWHVWPENESSLLGMGDVIPFRVDRTKALGNSVCVKQAREAFKELMGLL